ncbi:calcium-binding protein [Microvirga sp. ACRRW]|uniref:calcium-binding protein n=1 Tax=Microvirga sp. ACRRW TaxID=2918205 RepID=UPI001EF6EA0D|nr:calcium-binding protein [Microvirga sp. ACRRW]MCG7393864.1 calcium-binding protein [Microvirga sp. ACRRW]
MSFDSFYSTNPVLASLTEEPGPRILGLNHNSIFPSPAVSGIGMPVLIDRFQNAQIKLNAGKPLKELSVYSAYSAKLGIMLDGTGITLSTPALGVGSEIKIAGKIIGRVSRYMDGDLRIEFTAATTSTAIEAQRLAAEKLVRALTYTRLDSDQYMWEKTIWVDLTDTADLRGYATVLVADRVIGDAGDNVLEIDNNHLSWGDEVIGGEGYDVLKLTGSGFVDFTRLARLDGIEAIQGSEYGGNIFVHANQLSTLQKIDSGSSGLDNLKIAGTTIDLRGKVISGFDTITYDSDKATVIVDDLRMACLLDGFYATDDKVVISSGPVSDPERIFLHDTMNIEIVVHKGRATYYKDLAGKNLKGTTKKDTLKGSLGKDKLNGGSGNDTLSGGYDKDVFVFNSALGSSKTDRKVNVDKISDFNVLDDTIYLENKIFLSLKKTGVLNKALFKIGAKAGDKNDFILYDKKTGYLSYDADGSGRKHAPVEFAKLAKNLPLTFDDFRVI